MDTRVDKSSKKIEKMFDDISPIYDMMNNLISLNTHKIIKKSALKRLKIKSARPSITLYLCIIIPPSERLVYSIGSFEPYKITSFCKGVKFLYGIVISIP